MRRMPRAARDGTAPRNTHRRLGSPANRYLQNHSVFVIAEWSLLDSWAKMIVPPVVVLQVVVRVGVARQQRKSCVSVSVNTNTKQCDDSSERQPIAAEHPSRLDSSSRMLVLHLEPYICIPRTHLRRQDLPLRPGILSATIDHLHGPSCSTNRLRSRSCCVWDIAEGLRGPRYA